MAKKKKKTELIVVDEVATEEPTAEEEATQAQPQEAKEEVVEVTPKKQKDYKKTVHMGKDRFGNPRSQRDFESTLRNFLDAEDSYEAWQAWSKGGTVTLVIKK